MQKVKYFESIFSIKNIGSKEIRISYKSIYPTLISSIELQESKVN